MVYATWGISVRISRGREVPLKSVWIDLFAIATGIKISLNPMFIISYAFAPIIAPFCFMSAPFDIPSVLVIFDIFLAGYLMRIFQEWSWITGSHLLLCQTLYLILYRQQTHGIKRLESELILELEHLLDHEDLLWRQKSRSDWALHGDRNTRYFHRRAVNRKQRNKITVLKLPDGTWCDDVATLQDEATHYFA
ncbi:hypothetical protein V6N13_114205 [Hibiscus sabdariffa]